MAHDSAVQLYPRTTWIIMYCLMILAVLGLMTLFDRTRGWADRLGRADGARPGARLIPARVVQQVAAGMVCVIALFGAMGAGWSVNRYMPEDPAKKTMGTDAWRAHTIKKADGSCPVYSPVSVCADPVVKVWRDAGDHGFIWCGSIPPESWPAVCGRRAPWDDAASE
jgi:galactan 5-O-arabinofuranosyltransferase